MKINHLIEKYFPGLAGSKDEPVRQLLDAANTVTLPAGHQVFRIGDECQNYLLVLEGNVRVFLTTETGRDVVLYHVRPGESCVLTTSCLLGHDDYPAEGVTDTETIALAIGASIFNDALATSKTFRDFVFANLSQRISQMIARIEQVTIRAIDKRLAEILLNAASPSNQIKITHQQIAAELGTAREVISRHLKHFEKSGWVKLGRGTVEIIDNEALNRLIPYKV